ncbi:HK97 family phage prohead protease [Henriciella barbarensis]|uniref:HK97 family phage prohead protease n=1 Tax=Henriciella barbarensis TaxID=86342 RepID=A0A399QRU0_9PROT|nr:HK97 family phage prohead protease [Henriciella barbarensis]RIJ20382.1 HK97 family phage prohead protease [Henriciella barbarensis]
MRSAPFLVEGYAALFGAPDLSGDVVRAGAFARSLRAGAVPMLLQHRSGAVAGHWTRMMEDGRGLFVRGLIDGEVTMRAVTAGLCGLSIGFRARLWKPRPEGGRDLIDIDLVEISLVAAPMQPLARFTQIGGAARAA